MSHERPLTRRVRLVAGPALGVAGVAGGAAAYLSSQLVGVHRRRRYHHRLVAIDGDRVVLRRNRETERPGTYGLVSATAHAVIGNVEARTDRSVVRPLLRVDHGSLLPGRVALDHVHIGDPRSALGLDYASVELRGDTGPLPAWVVPGGDTWVVLAHGLGGSLASSLSFLPLVHGAGHTALVASYRNDPGAASSPDRKYHLGDEEWRDLDVALAYALDQGARHIVVHGWSLGAAVALQVLARSRRAGTVSGLVLDSPVLDWRHVLRHVGRRTRVPAPVVGLTVRVVEQRIGIDLDAFDWLVRADELAVPILVFHGETDPTVPFELSAGLARRRPDLVDLAVVPGAGHVGSWNVDPDDYALRIAAFIEAVTERSPASAAPVTGPGAGKSSQAID